MVHASVGFAATALPHLCSPCVHSPRMCATPDGSDGTRRRRPRPVKPARAASQLERTVEDLMGKRMGRGYIYYGERTRLASDEEAQADVDAEAAAAAEENPDDGLLKENPVLVTGATGRTGQWIALGLVNQGFNVRAMTRVFDRAEELYGPSGANVDVFQADVGDEEAVRDAMDGAVALVIASAAEWWRVGGREKVERDGAVALVEAAKLSGSVERVILIVDENAGSARGQCGAVAEEALKKSGLKYVIVRVPALSEEQGGMSKILLEQNGETKGGSLARVDAAQVVCQAMVYERAMKMMNEVDPDGGFEFGNCIFSARNGPEPSIVDKLYWKKAFSALDEQ